MKSIENTLVKAARRGKCVARGSPSAGLHRYIKNHINWSYYLVQPCYPDSQLIEVEQSRDKVSVRMSKTSAYITKHQEALNTKKTLVKVTQKVVQMSHRYDNNSWTKMGQE